MALRKDIGETQAYLKRIERGPAKNSMLAAATAVRLSELRTELAEREEAKARGEVWVETGSVKDALRDSGGPEQPDSLTPTNVEVLTAAHLIASTPEGRTPLGITSLRTALDNIEPAYRNEDGLLWADEALTRIEQGDNSRAQWEKVADNLATLLPEGSDRHE